MNVLCGGLPTRGHFAMRCKWRDDCWNAMILICYFYCTLFVANNTLKWALEVKHYMTIMSLSGSKIPHSDIQKGTILCLRSYDQQRSEIIIFCLPIYLNWTKSFHFL